MSRPKGPAAGTQSRRRNFSITLGYVIVAATVAAGVAMNIWPHRFGLPGPNPAVAVGLAALALFRLYALRRELKRQEEEAASAEPAPPARRSKRRPAARRA